MAKRITPHRRHARRRFAATATVILAIATLLAACSSSNDGSRKSDDAARSMPAAEGSTQYPLTFDGPFGKTVISERPTRIAVDNVTALDSVLALGVTPVLERHGADTADLPWRHKDKLDNIETNLEHVSVKQPINYEAYAAAEPDLIIATGTSTAIMGQEGFERLSAIAPVLVGSADPQQQGWDDDLKRIGEALDLGRKADDLATALHTKLAALPAQHPELRGKTFSYEVISDENYGVWVQGYEGGQAATLLEPFGIRVAPGSQGFSAKNFKLSPENYGNLNADILILAVQDSKVNPRYFFDNPVTKQVPAIEKNRYILFRPDPKTGFEPFSWGISRQSVLSVDWVINRLIEEVAKLGFT